MQIFLSLTGASFLFVFLLGVYGIYTYRKRRDMQIELIEKRQGTNSNYEIIVCSIEMGYPPSLLF